MDLIVQFRFTDLGLVSWSELKLMDLIVSDAIGFTNSQFWAFVIYVLEARRKDGHEH